MAEPRAIGATGMVALPLMLGGNVFGWTADKAASFAVLDAFAAGGGALVDTAEIYSAWVPGNGGGESETILGEWLASSRKRDRMLIATKSGTGARGRGVLTAAYVAAAAEASLKRLQTDHIDLYFAHHEDPDVPIEETLGALDRLVRAGKVGAIGCSNYSADRLAQALAASDANGLTRYTVLEPYYNLLERGRFEGALQDLAVSEGVAVVPYYGLASGFLTGKYRTAADVGKSGRGDVASQYLAGKGPAVLAAMDTVATESGASLAAIALAWLRAQPAIAAPIASATSAAQVEELVAGLDLDLTAQQVAVLNKASA